MLKRKSLLYKVTQTELDLKYKTNIFSNRIMSLLLIGLFCFTDFTCVYPVFESFLKDSQMMIIIFSMAFCACLDISMYLAGTYIKNFEDIKNKIEVKLLFSVFLVSWVLFVALRISTINNLFSDDMLTFSSNLENFETQLDIRHIVIGLVLSFLPLATSALSFLVGLSSSKDKEFILYKKQILNCILIKERINNLLLSNNELKNSQEELLTYDQCLYEINKKNINLERENLKLLSELKAVEKIATVEGVDKLAHKYREE